MIYIYRGFLQRLAEGLSQVKGDGKHRPYPHHSSIIPNTAVVFVLVFALSIILLPAAAHADGGAPNLAYIAGTKQGISIIDIQQQKVTGTFSVRGDPHTIYLSLDGRFLYVTQPQLGQVAMIAAKTGQQICVAHVPGHPTLLTFDSGSNKLFTAANDASTVSEIDPATCKIEQTFQVGDSVYGLATADIGSSSQTVNQLWVAHATSITVFNIATGGHIVSVPIAGGPQYLSIPPGTTVYATTHQGSIDAIDINSYHAVTLLKGGVFGPMDYDAITGEVYVPDQQHQQLDVLTPLSSGTATLPQEPARVYHLSASPQAVAITSDGQLGFIALKGGNVAMLDVPGKQIVNTIYVGGTPHFIITGLYPPVFGTNPQQASAIDNIVTIIAVVLVAEAIIIPLFFLWRRARNRKQPDQKPD